MLSKDAVIVWPYKLVLGKQNGKVRVTRAAHSHPPTPMGAKSIWFGPPRVRPMARACGEPSEIKENPTREILPLSTTAFFSGQGWWTGPVHPNASQASIKDNDPGCPVSPVGHGYGCCCAVVRAACQRPTPHPPPPSQRTLASFAPSPPWWCW